MDSVLIVSGTVKGADFFTDLLKEFSFSRVTTVRSSSEARRVLLESEPDLVIINTPLADEFGHELAISAADSTTSGIIMIIKAEDADMISAKVEDYGVFVVPKPMNRQFFCQSVKLVTTFRQRVLVLKNEKLKLQQKIDEMKLVDRAKCALIQYLGMTEAQAHRCIEKQAMDMRITKREVARNILQTYES